MRTGLLMLSLLLIACGASKVPPAVSPQVARTKRADELRMRTPDTLSRSPGLVLGELQPVPVGPKRSRKGTMTRAEHTSRVR